MPTTLDVATDIAPGPGTCLWMTRSGRRWGRLTGREVPVMAPGSGVQDDGRDGDCDVDEGCD